MLIYESEISDKQNKEICNIFKDSMKNLAIKTEDFKHHACEGMIMFGGDFVSHLGHALARADIYNSLKILKTFDKECREQANLFIKFKEKRGF